MIYGIYFIISLVISLLLVPKIRSFALANGIIDKPNKRKIHRGKIARLGGVAVFLAFWLVIILVSIFNQDLLNFSGNKFLLIDSNVWAILIGSLIMLILGIIDDIRGVKSTTKLFWHFIVGFIVVCLGIKIWWVHNPFGGFLTIDDWSYLLVPLWVVLMINVMNWWDGVDGQASGIGIIASIIIFILSISKYVDQPSSAIIMIILAGSLLGFLRYNFNPASIFLGDSGSQFIGFMLAIGAIVSGAKIATASLVLGFPILDAMWVIIRRILSKKSIFEADRMHFHHRLLDLGYSQKKTVLIMYLISAFFGTIALMTLGRSELKLLSLIWLFFVMIVTGIILSLKAKQYGRK